MHIATATLVVPTYAEGIDFYVGAVGLDLLADDDQGGGKRWVLVGGTGLSLLLAQAADDRQRARIGDQTGGRVAFFLHTEDFAADHARMSAAGVCFLEEPRHEVYGTVAVFTDPWGTTWDLIQPATQNVT